MKIRIDAKSSHSAVIVLQRTFGVPRDLVWAALTEPKHVTRWYGGGGFQSAGCEMDVRPGGTWRHVLRGPDGAEHRLEFVFGDVLAPEKLSWKEAGNRTTVMLEAAGEETKWKLVARFDTYAARDAAHKAGFARVIAEGTQKLDAVLTTLAGG